MNFDDISWSNIFSLFYVYSKVHHEQEKDKRTVKKCTKKCSKNPKVFSKNALKID